MTWLLFFVPDLNSLSWKSDNSMFKVLNWVILNWYYIKRKIKWQQSHSSLWKIQNSFLCLFNNDKYYCALFLFYVVVYGIVTGPVKYSLGDKDSPCLPNWLTRETVARFCHFNPSNTVKILRFSFLATWFCSKELSCFSHSFFFTFSLNFLFFYLVSSIPASWDTYTFLAI